MPHTKIQFNPAMFKEAPRYCLQDQGVTQLTRPYPSMIGLEDLVLLYPYGATDHQCDPGNVGDYIQHYLGKDSVMRTELKDQATEVSTTDPGVSPRSQNPNLYLTTW